MKNLRVKNISKLFINNLAVIALVIFAIFWQSSVNAMVVYSQSPVADDSFLGDGVNITTANDFFVFADDFGLVADTIVTSVRWWGIYGGSVPLSVENTDFSVTFYSDNGGLPDENSIVSTIQSTVTRTTTTLVDTFFGDDIFQFEMTIPSIALSADTPYYLSVENHLFDDFYWIYNEPSVETNHFVRDLLIDDPFVEDVDFPYNFAFQILGEQDAQVSEPSSLILLVFGLILLSLRRKVK